MRRPFLFLCSVLFSLVVFAQSQNVTGVVNASDGAPLPASVLIKGTTRGTNTDAQGKYSIQNVPQNAILVISSVGYKTVEIPVNGNSVVNASLQPDAQALDEVIAVAYGSAKKGSFTGSASVINESQIRENKRH